MTYLKMEMSVKDDDDGDDDNDDDNENALLVPITLYLGRRAQAFVFLQQLHLEY
jgi:hypothetical protein